MATASVSISRWIVNAEHWDVISLSTEKQNTKMCVFFSFVWMDFVLSALEHMLWVVIIQSKLMFHLCWRTFALKHFIEKLEHIKTDAQISLSFNSCNAPWIWSRASFQKQLTNNLRGANKTIQMEKSGIKNADISTLCAQNRFMGGTQIVSSNALPLAFVDTAHSIAVVLVTTFNTFYTS